MHARTRWCVGCALALTVDSDGGGGAAAAGDDDCDNDDDGGGDEDCDDGDGGGGGGGGGSDACLPVFVFAFVFPSCGCVSLVQILSPSGDMIEFLEHGLRIIAWTALCGPSVSPQLWELFPKIYNACVIACLLACGLLGRACFVLLPSPSPSPSPSQPVSCALCWGAYLCDAHLFLIF